MLMGYQLACAESAGFGSIAQGINEPLTVLIQFVRIVCIVTGVGLIVGGFVKYKQHRDNPVEVPLSSCIFLVLGGIALIVLTFIPLGKG